MPYIIKLNTFSDSRGNLTVIDKVLPFEIKRVYYIYDVPPEAVRAGHRHKKNVQALVCLRGSCNIFVDDSTVKQTFILDSPDKCLLLEPRDWHTMSNFSRDAVLLVMASEHYDISDYIDEGY
jgi:dTDP-4-dehydrorhamnose 3,5-epimerase-like enzyme